MLALLLIDNAAWLGSFAVRNTQGFRLTADEVELFQWLNEPENRGTVVLSHSTIAYLATAYTPLRAWVSHVANVPDNAARIREVTAFLDSGALPPSSSEITLLAVVDERAGSEIPDPTDLQGRDARWVYQNRQFKVLRIEPASPDSRSSGRAPLRVSGR